MPAKPAPVPESYHTATPYLMVADGGGALEFYAKAFGATITERMTTPEGRTMHAEFRIGDSMFMLGEHSNLDSREPALLPRVSLYLYLPDVDATFAAAVAAGAKEISPLRDQFYGNREGGVEDPWGIVWWVATRTEEVTPEELARRAAAAMPA
jgi:PhnB protein